MEGGREGGHHPEQPDPHQHQGDRSHSPHAICHQVAELRPLRLCGGGGRKEREGSERVGHTDSRGEILFSNQRQEGEVNFLSKSESSLSLFVKK